MKQEIARNIHHAGQHMFAIGPDEASEPFVYTIGNRERNLPELLCIGRFPRHLIGMLLNQLGATQRERGTPYEAGIHDIGWSIPIKIRQCGPKACKDYTIQAGVYYNVDIYPVTQVMLCDKNGHYQDDPACEWGVVDQP